MRKLAAVALIVVGLVLGVWQYSWLRVEGANDLGIEPGCKSSCVQYVAPQYGVPLAAEHKGNEPIFLVNFLVFLVPSIVMAWLVWPKHSGKKP